MELGSAGAALRRLGGGAQVTGYAEEVHKLVATLRDGNTSTAAVQRSLLAVHLAPVLAVHRRILYGTENRLWDLVDHALAGGS